MRFTPLYFATASEAIKAIGQSLSYLGQDVHATRWQGTKSPAPMLELLEPSFRIKIAPTIEELQEDIHPNLPWADEHFEERVSRIPSNPGESWKHWPFYPKNQEMDEIVRAGERFTHTYQERIWSKKAGSESEYYTNIGVRYEYGDLDDVIQHLAFDPMSRQAFLPIWFPEDTGAVHGGRVPCTLGYLFMQRYGYLHCTYYIRSCDYFRHFRDDIYLACRLTLWVLESLKHMSSIWDWSKTFPGSLNMHIGSLHCWLIERSLLPR